MGTKHGASILNFTPEYIHIPPPNIPHVRFTYGKSYSSALRSPGRTAIENYFNDMQGLLIDKEIYDYIITLVNPLLVSSYRKDLVQPYEIPIFVGGLNIAFEVIDTFWDKNVCCTANHHAIKTIQMYKKGITLIHIFSDDWIHKKESMLKRIKNLLQPPKVETISIYPISTYASENFINSICEMPTKDDVKYMINVNGVPSIVATFTPTLGAPVIVRYYSTMGGTAIKFVKLFIEEHYPGIELKFAFDLRYGVPLPSPALALVSPRKFYVEPKQYNKTHKKTSTAYEINDCGLVIIEL